MKENFFEDFARYTCTHSDYDHAEAVIMGIPYDQTTSHNPGARFGPRAIRTASWTVETYSPDLDRDLNSLSLYDINDISIYGTQEELFRNIFTVAHEMVSEGKKLVTLGGEHSVTYPVIQGIKEALGDLLIISFDAHLDLREEYLGNKLSHACVARRCLEITPHFYHFGIRSGDADEWHMARRLKVARHLPRPEHITTILDQDLPVYVTIDIDVLDPAFAPGTGAPEPGGVSTTELLQSLHLLQPLRKHLIGFDVMEVCPPCEHGTVTATTAAKIVRDMLLVSLG